MPYKDPAKQLEFQRRWMRQRREAWMQGKSCLCGSTERLELDWIGEGKGNKNVWSLKPERMAAKLEGYRVLCWRCRDQSRRISVDEQAAIALLYNQGFGERAIKRLTGKGYRTVNSYTECIPVSPERADLKKARVLLNKIRQHINSERLNEH